LHCTVPYPNFQRYKNDGYTQTEVAEIYHTTISAINKRMKRITKRLIKLVVDEGGIR